MISKLIKYTGLFIIILFSAASVFFAISLRDFQDYPRLFKAISYSSFFEDRFYDIRMKKTLDPNFVDKRIVLVAIDDISIQNIGQWPLPRMTWVTMMKKLKSYGAKIIAYDVFFSSMSNSCDAIPPEEYMREAIADFQSVPGNKVILPFQMVFEEDNVFETTPDYLYNFMLDTQEASGVNLRPHFVDRSVFPLDVLLKAEPAVAHIEARSDTDGVFRHYPFVAYNDGLYIPSFALSVYQHFTGDKTKLIVHHANEAELQTEKSKFTLNYNGEIKIRWVGGEAAFPRVSLYDVYTRPENDPEMKQIFDGNIVFVGSTAFGAHDIRHTPVDPMLPGVFFHINATHMLLEGRTFVSPSVSTKYSWWMLVIGTLVMLIIQIKGNAIFDLIGVVGICASMYFIDLKYLLPTGHEIKLFWCLFSVVSCYSWNTFLHFYLAGKDKQFLKNAFGTYISPELIDIMYKTGESPKLGGDSGVRTAFFTDIQGFSSFSEKLSATQLVELLNEYLTDMTDILLREGGTLDKYEGDAIIAFFGAPMPMKDHATRACKVAVMMQEKLAELRKKWTAEGDKWPHFVHEMRMRIGINSGEIVTGNMGSRSRMNYTMMGDAVNLAARLEASAKQYGIFTQVSVETKKLCEDIFVWRELDTVRVVGKSIPVQTFELLGYKETCPDFVKELGEKFTLGVSLYKEQKWDEAIAIFKQTLELEYQRFPELKGKKTNPSEIYLERCEEYKKLPPPPDWDGAYTLTEK
ncbi:MAG: adenylate/guanylate cyclase domain-containing protein [Bacteriovoracaceae bacterium]